MVVIRGAFILLSSFFIVTAEVVSHDEALEVQAVDVKLAVSAPPAAGPLLTTLYAPPPAPAEVSPPPAPVKTPAPLHVKAFYPVAVTGTPASSISPPPAIAPPPALSSPPDKAPPPAVSSPPDTAPPPAAPRPSVTSKKDCIPLCLKRCHWRLRKKVCMRACMKCCDRCRCVPPGPYGNREACGYCYTHDSNGCKCP